MFFPIMVSVVVILAFYTVRNRCTSGHSGVGQPHPAVMPWWGRPFKGARWSSLPGIPKGGPLFPVLSRAQRGFWGVESSAPSHHTHHFSHPLPTVSGIPSSGRHTLSCSFRLASSPPFSLGSLLNTPETASSPCTFIQVSPETASSPCTFLQVSPPRVLVSRSFPPCDL